jgi:hypothetical protein
MSAEATRLRARLSLRPGTLSMNTYVFSVGALCGMFANYDGLRNIVSAAYDTPGAENAFLAPVWLLAIVLAVSVGGRTRLLRTDRVSAAIAVRSVTGAVLLTIVAAVGSRSAGAAPKWIRDCFYLWFFAGSLISTNLLLSREDGGSRHLKAFVEGFCAAFVAATIVGLLLHQFDANGRFTGLQLTASMFGNSVAFVAYFYLSIARGAVWRILILGSALALIVLSGTRSALVLLGLLLLHATVSLRDPKERWLSLALIALAGVLGALTIEDPANALSGVRVVSAGDVEVGSLRTRLYWYDTLLQTLTATGGLGGFGAGAAESALGYIPHADLLRFWFDYGLLFAALLIAWIPLCAVPTRGAGRLRAYADRALAVTVFATLTFHNVFQAPNLLFEFVMLCAIIPHVNRAPRDAGPARHGISSGSGRRLLVT